MFKASVLSGLRSSIEDNLDLYRKGKFNHIVEDDSNYFECEFDLDEMIWHALVPNNDNISEITNCKIMLEALG